MAIETVGVRTGRQRNSNGGTGGPIVLGPNDSLKGTLRTDNSITIHGDVDGEIFAGGDVVVELSATVVSTIEARNVDIRGQVTGNVKSAQRLRSAARARSRATRPRHAWWSRTAPPSTEASR